MTDTPQAPQERSHLSRKWTLKIGIIAIALIAFGLWGLYDAVIRYPARGSQAAEFLEFRYLDQLNTDHNLYKATIDDPAAKLTDLEKRAKESTPSPADQALHAWLDQLVIIGKLQPEATKIPRTDFRKDDKGQPIYVGDPSQRHRDLRTKWTASSVTPPPPLNRFDILMQWLIVAGGVGAGGWLLFLIIAAKTKVYRWDPASQTLTLPGGGSITPTDIAEFDKRKWHRLFITLKIKPTHPQLGGKDIEIDLLRFEPVEEWVLAMEKTVNPESAEAPESPAEPSAPIESPAP
jgi:hypothetical protein